METPSIGILTLPLEVMNNFLFCLDSTITKYRLVVCDHQRLGVIERKEKEKDGKRKMAFFFCSFI